MNVEKLLNNNPLSKELIRQWFLEKRAESANTAKDIPDEFRKSFIEMGINDEILNLTIESNPHSLFEIFDENEIFIDVFRKKMQFTFDINSKQLENRYSMVRKDAEMTAINVAIIVLENKLNEIKNTDDIKQ